MRLFFDTVWKLHIGEIPEKPKKEDHATYLSYYPELFKYNEAIAAIKQNALTVLNPEIGIVESSCGTKCMIDGYVGWDRVLLHSPIQADKFYKWIGGYETKEIEIDCSPSDQVFYKTVAILTMPEEKKNTMENMTKEQELTEAEKFLIKKSQECPPFTHDGLNQLPYILVSAVAKCMEEFVQFSLYKDHPATASGSVAAPKEEHPDFNEWIKLEEGQSCMKWPISEPKYLQNRLFWAFDAGRNCVWDQFINQKTELASLRQQLEGMKSILKEIEFQVYAEGWSPQERLAEIKKKFPKH